MAIALAVVGTMAASFAVDLLRLPKGYRQALRVLVMMIGIWCAVKLGRVLSWLTDRTVRSCSEPEATLGLDLPYYSSGSLEAALRNG